MKKFRTKTKKTNLPYIDLLRIISAVKEEVKVCKKCGAQDVAKEYQNLGKMLAKIKKGYCNSLVNITITY